MKIKNLIVKSFTLLILVSSCTTESEKLEALEQSEINYMAITSMVKAEMTSLQKMREMDTEGNMERIVQNMDREFQKNTESAIDTLVQYFEKTQFSAEDISESFTEGQRIFLASFYTEMTNSEGDLITIIESHKGKLETVGFTEEEYGQLFLQLTIMENSAIILFEAIDDVYGGSETQRGPCSGFSNCFSQRVGRNVAQGMVFGAAVGGVGGGITGAAGGTVVLPGVGTTTGAVGGSVFGAAAGVTTGALGGILWSAGGCANRLNSKCLTGWIDRFWNQ